MTARERLPNRRPCETFAFQCNGLSYFATIGRYSDGRLAEIFIGNAKVGSHSDSAAKDSAIAASLALQHGCEPEILRRAVLRDAQGRSATPLGAVLDLLAEQEAAP
jgi:hypothetical protein